MPCILTTPTLLVLADDRPQASVAAVNGSEAFRGGAPQSQVTHRMLSLAAGDVTQREPSLRWPRWLRCCISAPGILSRARTSWTAVLSSSAATLNPALRPLTTCSLIRTHRYPLPPPPNMPTPRLHPLVLEITVRS
ncbi:hypothetical protein LZ554_006862 [Drepanopeziza brunnea f. sp. 'monogermtubi']|nr:hypothetical protein LZ554_006862 [Drepanopeziza brunnea f. sp. 'monogermtubi']